MVSPLHVNPTLTTLLIVQGISSLSIPSHSKASFVRKTIEVPDEVKRTRMKRMDDDMPSALYSRDTSRPNALTYFLKILLASFTDIRRRVIWSVNVPSANPEAPGCDSWWRSTWISRRSSRRDRSSHRRLQCCRSTSSHRRLPSPFQCTQDCPDGCMRTD